MQKSQRVVGGGSENQIQQNKPNNQIKRIKMDANFSSLTHLKATLVGRTGGQLWGDRGAGGGRGGGVHG